MSIELIEALNQLSNTGFWAFIWYAIITSLADWVLLAGMIYGVRTLWKADKTKWHGWEQ